MPRHSHESKNNDASIGRSSQLQVRQLTGLLRAATAVVEDATKKVK